ncbi:MAG: FliA/WhiG family RNA polymerase sigma factor, partial [Aquificae bacterium]|nr:FliA/WhiG family RNA polymerase sigma factor [Aquificota bacterium]
MNKEKIKKEKEKIVKELEGVVRRIARRIAREDMPPSVSGEDLIQEGYIGLLKAYKKYDKNKNVKFLTYAEYRIAGEIIDSLRRLDWKPRRDRQLAREIDEAIKKLEQQLKREPTTEEVARCLNMSEEEYKKVEEKVNNGILISLDATIGKDDEEGETKLWQVIPSNDNDPEKWAEKENLERIIKRLIDKLDDREKNVINLYYYDEVPMKKIGEVLGLTESRISQIHSKAIK